MERVFNVKDQYSFYSPCHRGKECKVWRKLKYYLLVLEMEDDEI